VAQFSQRFIRSVIRQLWNQSKAGANTFREALNAAQSGHWEKVATGFTVVNSSGAGYSTSFHIAASPDDVNNLTPQAMQELCEHILENYAQVATAGTAEEGTDIDAMDSKFVQALWNYFPTIKIPPRNNWSGMRT
jgi:hypothetical protein